MFFTLRVQPIFVWVTSSKFQVVYSIPPFVRNSSTYCTWDKSSHDWFWKFVFNFLKNNYIELSKNSVTKLKFYLIDTIRCFVKKVTPLSSFVIVETKKECWIYCDDDFSITRGGNSFQKEEEDSSSDSSSEDNNILSGSSSEGLQHSISNSAAWSSWSEFSFIGSECGFVSPAFRFLKKRNMCETSTTVLFQQILDTYLNDWQEWNRWVVSYFRFRCDMLLFFHPWLMMFF